jgi:putative effector of murein hydrolase
MTSPLYNIVGTPLFGISLTLVAYQASQVLFQKSNQFPLLNPVLIAVTLIITTLKLGHISFDQYWQGAQIFSFFNGIVVVALAIPLYRYAKEIKQCYLEILIAVFFAALIASFTGIILAKVLNLDDIILRSVAARSVTTPLAILITEVVHGNSALITLFAILNGICSSIICFPLLKKLSIENEAVIGLTAGIAASAIGTAISFSKSYRMGSYAALGMILNGIFSAMTIPVLIKALAT